jgi:hypothetical protein
MKIIRPISLTKGKIAIIDEEDYKLVNKYRWNFNGRYAQSYEKNAQYKTITMHRLIMRPPIGFVVDHINHDMLDNRRCNLRICTQSQNEANKKINITNTSGKKGVSFDKKNNKWRATIRINHINVVIGWYSDIDKAGEAYLAKAKEIYGEFASSGD